MNLPLRTRILLTLAPLLALLAILGAAALALLSHLGGSVEQIMRENYRSVLYMERLNEAIERIDSSFHLALLADTEPTEAQQRQRQAVALEQYRDNWEQFRRNLADEQDNITLPGEAELVQRLQELGKQYRAQGDAFFARP